MTVIVGLIDNETVYMGADTLMVNGFDTSHLAPSVPKVFHRGPFLIGVTGMLRALQLVQFRLNPVIETKPGGDIEFMVTDFVDELRRVLKEGGSAHEENGIEHTGDRDDYSRFLVGYRGHLYNVGPDYHVRESTDDFAAIGSGEDFALGSLHSTQGINPESRVTLAIEAAMRFNAGCGGDVRIELLPCRESNQERNPND